MKKVYEKPIMSVENFAANEFIAACGDQNKVYKFTCDAGWTGLSGSHVWLNGPDGKPETADDISLGNYGKCGKTHEAPVTDEFFPGYLKKNIIGVPGGRRVDVLVWRGEKGDDIHCTSKLDINAWETLKS